MVPRGKKTKMLKKLVKNKKGLQKFYIKHVPNTSKDIFFKNHNFEYFQKQTPVAQTIKILKKIFQNLKGLQKLDIKHVPHAPT